jgi:glycosyltransferase involved in cell wall biosynthesis/SAM-dependent methyltransferase
MSRLATAFLLGVPRSGTTLLSLLLNQHPDIYCPPEPWVLLGLEALGQVPPSHGADSPLVSGAVSEFLGANRKVFLRGAAEGIYENALRQVGKSLFVDKTPRYYQSIDILDYFFPESRAVFLQRNPLDVAASYLTSWNVNLAEVIDKKVDSPFLFDYVIGFPRLLDFQSRHSDSVMALHYEDLVRNPEQKVADVFAYLGGKKHTVSATVDLEEAASAFLGDKKILDNPTVHAKSIDSYKLVFKPKQVGILLGALGRDTFVALGYEQVWEEACNYFSLDKIVDNSCELTELAEKFLSARKASCEKADNDYFSVQQADHLNAKNSELTQQVDHLNAKNSELTQQVDFFQHMGLRARATDLLRYSKRRTKQLVRDAIWRLAHGKPKPPLPRMSLVTPVFNGVSHIAETLESVLQQDYPDLEYIIVDGGSTDGTLDIIRHYQQRTDLPQRISLVVSEPDQGMYDAIAKGFEQASGEVYCYLNADDLLECNSLKSVGEYFAGHPATQVIYHEDVVLLDGWKYPNVRQPEGVDTLDLLAGHILFQDGVFWRREVYEAVGGIRRDLKLAGDFDLWLRMSAQCRFIRRPGHVSCFRIRPGQLSSEMQAYHTEMQQSIQDFMATISGIRRFGWQLKRPLRQLARKLVRKLQRDRLFFQIDFVNMPPPLVSVPPAVESIPLSPIDGKPVERLLFSTPDTRFGEQEINYVYLDDRHDIAITHPPIDPDKLDGLYRKYYSSPPTEMVLPTGASPYREFNGRRIWEKILLRLAVEKLDRFLPNSWADNTLAELKQVLKASKIDTKKPLCFLDTGCFEGHLLDQIREKTKWIAFGLEPNDHAVEVARSKGHSVWHGHAEDAVESIPEKHQFNVIFMGQSIEHVDDPVRVLRRLRLLLAPGGVLVMSTPNLDSIEIDHFGPTWAHWHVPYHRYIFSKKGLYSLVAQVGLLPTEFRSFSHPYWTTMSIAQNRLGLGGSASHAVNFDPAFSLRARRYQFWKKLIWNRFGKGDYAFMAAKDGAHE